MAARGLDLDLSILSRTAGFEIGEHLIPYAPTDSYGQAMLVGLLNTILISVLGIVFATIVGLGIGLARLSRNYLLSRLAAGYVEVFRNTPLLVQLFILYFAVFLQLPRVRDSIAVGEVLFINQRGIYLPAVRAARRVHGVADLSAIGIGSSARSPPGASRARRAAAGRSHRAPRPRSGCSCSSSLRSWPGSSLGEPFRLQLPEAGRFNIEGGIAIRAEFMALLLGLVLYTAAFIAEIVRGGIQAVPRGQVEARALDRALRGARAAPRRAAAGDARSSCRRSRAST